MSSCLTQGVAAGGRAGRWLAQNQQVPGSNPGIGSVQLPTMLGNAAMRTRRHRCRRD
jgi:hypothetical protein